MNLDERIKQLKPIIYKSMWAIFCPEGYIQLRSISPLRKESKELICRGEYDYNKNRYTTWQDYKAAGFTIHKVSVTVTPNINSLSNEQSAEVSDTTKAK